jgi:hypothetical protein
MSSSQGTSDISLKGKAQPRPGQPGNITRSELAQRIAREMLQADHQALETEIRTEPSAELAR